MSNLFAELNDKQIEAVQAIEGPVLVLAGAGSGKTKTLTHRLAYLISEKKVAPHRVLAVTFTNKAAGEMRQRAAALLHANPNSWQTWRGFGSGPALGTFHSVCARILREEAGKIGFKRSFVIYDTADQKSAMKQVMRLEGVSTKEVNPNTVLGMVSRAKNELLSPSEMASQARGPVEKRAARLYEQYQGFLEDHQAMDFDDLLMKVVQLFKKYSDILKAYQDRWQYLMIDEYQDTNHAQYEWARLLAGERKNIFVVGDDWQGIYSWRGATIRNILEFEKDFPGAKIVRLEQNYRSTSDIVELGNIIIAGNRGQMKKKLWTEKESEQQPEVWQVADEMREGEFVLEKIAEEEKAQGTRHKAQNDSKEEDNEVTYDYEAESGGSGILDRIMGTMKKGGGLSSPQTKPIRPALASVPFDIGQQKINWNKYAVLYRTNAQSRAIEEVLLKYGVPYRLIGGIRFYERREIKDTLAYLRFLQNPSDAVSASRIINEPSRGIGDKTLGLIQQYARERGAPLLDAMRTIDEAGGISASRAHAIKKFADIFDRAFEKLDQLTVCDMIDLVLKRADYIEYLRGQGDEGEERIENIEELKNVAKKFETIKGMDALEAFLEEVSLVADIDTYNPENGSALTLMTLHSAKGLEFETVFLVGMEEGLLPHSNSLIDPQQLEEERRLCYVGITRARDRLYFIHTIQRALHGSIVGNVASRFLSELGDEHARFFEEDMW